MERPRRKGLLIAEEVEKVNPLFVAYERGQVEGVKYPQLTAVLVNAVKELKADNDNLRAGLKAANDKQAADIATLRQELAALKAARK
jgi:hypothetical protein